MKTFLKNWRLWITLAGVIGFAILFIMGYKLAGAVIGGIAGAVGLGTKPKQPEVTMKPTVEVGKVKPAKGATGKEAADILKRAKERSKR